MAWTFGLQNSVSLAPRVDVRVDRLPLALPLIAVHEAVSHPHIVMRALLTYSLSRFSLSVYYATATVHDNPQYGLTNADEPGDTVGTHTAGVMTSDSIPGTVKEEERALPPTREESDDGPMAVATSPLSAPTQQLSPHLPGSLPFSSITASIPHRRTSIGSSFTGHSSVGVSSKGGVPFPSEAQPGTALSRKDSFGQYDPHSPSSRDNGQPAFGTLTHGSQLRRSDEDGEVDSNDISIDRADESLPATMDTFVATTGPRQEIDDVIVETELDSASAAARTKRKLSLGGSSHPVPGVRGASLQAASLMASPASANMISSSASATPLTSNLASPASQASLTRSPFTRAQGLTTSNEAVHSATQKADAANGPSTDPPVPWSVGAPPVPVVANAGAAKTVSPAKDEKGRERDGQRKVVRQSSTVPANGSSSRSQRTPGTRMGPQLPGAADVTPAPPPAMYWSKVPVHGSVPRRSFRAHSASLADEVMWLFGGCDAKGCFRDLYCFDTETMCWSKPKVTGDLPPPRRAHSATMVDKRLFVFAGGDGPYYFNDLYVFDTIALRWTKPDVFGQPPSPRRAHTSNYYDGQLIIFGGGNGVGALNDVYSLDITDLTRLEWRKIECRGNVPIGRGYHTSSLVDGKLIVIGGSDGHMSFNDIHILKLDTRVWYHVKTDETHNRLGHTATQVGSYLFVVGGHNSHSYTPDILTLNLVNLQWEPRNVCGKKPPGRGYHQSWLRDSRLFVHGGFDGKEVYDDLYYIDLSACAYLPQITSFSVEVRAYRRWPICQTGRSLTSFLSSFPAR